MFSFLKRASKRFRFPDNNPYALWRGTNVNPAWWFYETYHQIPHFVSDSRMYTDGLLQHIIKNGGEIIESTRPIDPAQGEADKDDTTPWGVLIGVSEGPEGNVQAGLWYKDHWFVVTGSHNKRTIGAYYLPSVFPNFDEFKQFLRPVEKGSVSVLLEQNGSLYTRKIDFEPPAIPNLELNYGTGFSVAHAHILEKLERRRAGLVLLHGGTGNGKSFYIKYLTSIIDRDFIFVPISMVHLISSPAFIKLLLEHEEAVLVLEDAEQALQSREEDIYNSSTVSSLLNLSDGILGTLLNITIIASFNMDKSNVDKALLRKGRLLYDHEFKKLSIDDATRLAAHLKAPLKAEHPTSLADIYNAAEETGYIPPVRKSIGFLGQTTP